MLVGRGRRAALGLDGDDLVAAELDHVEAAMDAPGRGAPFHAAGDQGVPGEGVAGRLLLGVGGGVGFAADLAAPGGALVLAAALDGLGRLDKDALDMFDVKEPRAIDELVAHADRDGLFGFGDHGALPTKSPGGAIRSVAASA